MTDSACLLLIASSKMQRTAAFERAVALARARDVGLHIVALNYIRIFAASGLLNEQVLSASYLRHHRRWLEQEAAHERKRGLDCKVQVLWSDHVFEAIGAYVRTMRPAMLIKDVHQEPTLRGLFSTPLDWYLLRDCRCPVQFVIDSDRPMPRKILAAVNLYRTEDTELCLNDEILHAAMRLGEQSGASVHALYSYDWPSIYAAGVTLLGTLPVEAGFHEALAEAHQEAFALLCEGYGIDSDHRHFLMGAALTIIDLFARHHHFDLLVLGTLPGNRFMRILGHTARALLGQASCSVVIVKATAPSLRFDL